MHFGFGAVAVAAGVGFAAGAVVKDSAANFASGGSWEQGD